MPKIASPESIESLRKRLQFVIVLALFFPTLLDALYQGVADQLTSSTLTLKWGMVVAYLIGCYLLVELLAKRILTWMWRAINFLLLVEVALFIPILIFFSQGSKALLTPFYLLLFRVLNMGLWLIPVVVAFLLVGLLIVRMSVASRGPRG